jgi:hypothetical protein
LQPLPADLRPSHFSVQVLLLRGDKVPQLRDRLALVLDHDQDIDVQRDREARREYAGKVRRAASLAA